MPRATAPRKLSEHGTTLTIWLPAGTAQLVEREARRKKLTRSKFVARLVRRAVVPRDDAERLPAAS